MAVRVVFFDLLCCSSALNLSGPRSVVRAVTALRMLCSDVVVALFEKSQFGGSDRKIFYAFFTARRVEQNV